MLPEYLKKQAIQTGGWLILVGFCYLSPVCCVRGDDQRFLIETAKAPAVDFIRGASGSVCRQHFPPCFYHGQAMMIPMYAGIAPVAVSGFITVTWWRNQGRSGSSRRYLQREDRRNMDRIWAGYS